MPNGSDKNYVRLCVTIDGFRARYGRWPTVARVWPGFVDNLRTVLAPEGFARLQEKLRLVEDPNATISVEDEEGRRCDYGSVDLPEARPSVTASEWIGAERSHPTPEELESYNRAREEFRKKHGRDVFIFPEW